MNMPFKQKTKNGLLIREFSEHIDAGELVWHRDHSDRVVVVVEGSGWSLQMDNQLPILLEAGRQYYIPKNTYHRVIKGSTKLVLEINETKPLLREYIRELLTEAAYGLSEFEKRGYGITIEDRGDTFEIKLHDVWPPEPGYLGIISAMQNAGPDNGPCLGGYTVTWSSVSEDGWGPLLYDLAMEHATAKGSGLTPDRQEVSFEANKVWDYYLANRSDVEMVQMDDLSNRLTPGTKEDNCAMTLAYERGLESGTFWDEDNLETPWDPYGKEVLEQSPLSKMGVWKGAANIDAIKAMDRWIEI